MEWKVENWQLNCFLFSTWKNVGMLDHSFGITVLIKTHHKFLNQQHPENEFTRKITLLR
jgi:hypothetical protein